MFILSASRGSRGRPARTLGVPRQRGKFTTFSSTMQSKVVRGPKGGIVPQSAERCSVQMCCQRVSVVELPPADGATGRHCGPENAWRGLA